MSEIGIIVNTAVAILAVVVMIVRFKFNPVVSLVIGSAYLGLATGLGVEKTIEAITTGFGEIMAEVGLLIAFGVLMGAILQQTGAIQRLVETLLKVFGAKRMPYAMSLTIATFLQSIFLDVLLVISAPLARTLAKKIGRNGVGADGRGDGDRPGVRHRADRPRRRRAGAGRPARRAARQDAAVRCAAGDPHRGDLGGDHVVPVQPRLVERGARRAGVPRRRDPELLDDDRQRDPTASGGGGRRDEGHHRPDPRQDAAARCCSRRCSPRWR